MLRSRGGPSIQLKGFFLRPDDCQAFANGRHQVVVESLFGLIHGPGKRS